MNIKRLIAIFMVFSWVFMHAQENTPIMTVHQQGGRELQFIVGKVDTMAFTSARDTLIVRSKEGNTWWFALQKLDSISFSRTNSANIHEAIDLGLSVMWATHNVGSTNPEDYGDLYAWGECDTKNDYAEKRYSFFKNEQYQHIGVNICATPYDVAHQKWGEGWRMPTRSEIKELTTRCTWSPETLNGVKGYRVTGTNGNSIFLPAAGYQPATTRINTGEDGFYWSGSLNRTMTSAAYNLNFRGYDAEWTASRAYGMSIRPVK